MSLSVSRQSGRLCLAPFEPQHAGEIARWVETPEQLHWVAPSSQPPLTAEKVARWVRPEGAAFVMTCSADSRSVGYGELNPMRADPDQMWLGHIILRPDDRGRGTGQTLVRSLVEHAFEHHSANRVLLIVFPDNAAAVGCYRRVGFQIVGEEFHRFGGAGPKYRLLRLEIDPAGMGPGGRCHTADA